MTLYQFYTTMKTFDKLDGNILKHCKENNIIIYVCDKKIAQKILMLDSWARIVTGIWLDRVMSNEVFDWFLVADLHNIDLQKLIKLLIYRRFYDIKKYHATSKSIIESFTTSTEQRPGWEWEEDK